MIVTVHPDGSGTTIEIDEWDRDLTHEQFMAEVDRRTKPRLKPRKNLYSDHPWDPQTLTCNSCGITSLTYYNVAYGAGLPCVDNQS